jgi:hypothetical protein
VPVVEKIAINDEFAAIDDKLVFLRIADCGVNPLSKLRPGFAKVGAVHGDPLEIKLLPDPDLSTHVLIGAFKAGAVPVPAGSLPSTHTLRPVIDFGSRNSVSINLEDAVVP